MGKNRIGTREERNRESKVHLIQAILSPCSVSDGRKSWFWGWWMNWRHERAREMISPLSEKGMWDKEPLEKVKWKNHRQWQIAILPSWFSRGSGQSMCAILHILLAPAEWKSISHRWCYCLDVVPLPLFGCWNANCQVTEFGSGASGRWLGDESAFIIIISALIKAVLENSIIFSAIWGCNKKIAI